MGRHFLTTRQAKDLDEVVRWYKRLGCKLRLWTRQPNAGNHGGHAIYQGKLDSALASTSTSGVTFSIWDGNPPADTGKNIPNVLPPIVMTSGTLGTSSPVVVQRIGRYHRVTHAECDT